MQKFLNFFFQNNWIIFFVFKKNERGTDERLQKIMVASSFF